MVALRSTEHTIRLNRQRDTSGCTYSLIRGGQLAPAEDQLPMLDEPLERTGLQRVGPSRRVTPSFGRLLQLSGAQIEEYRFGLPHYQCHSDLLLVHDCRTDTHTTA